MRVSAENGDRGELLDLDTGELVRGVIWCDMGQSPMMLEAYRLDLHGRPVRDRHGRYATYAATGRFRWTPADRLPRRKRTPPPREDLCGTEFRGDRRQRHERVTALILDRRCQHYGCIRVAEWLVSDEVALPPVRANNRLWPVCKVVGVRFYCEHHYRPPRLLDGRGEVVETFEEAGGVRPQWHS